MTTFLIVLNNLIWMIFFYIVLSHREVRSTEEEKPFTVKPIDLTKSVDKVLHPPKKPVDTSQLVDVGQADTKDMKEFMENRLKN